MISLDVNGIFLLQRHYRNIPHPLAYRGIFTTVKKPREMPEYYEYEKQKNNVLGFTWPWQTNLQRCGVGAAVGRPTAARTGEPFPLLSWKCTLPTTGKGNNENWGVCLWSDDCETDRFAPHDKSTAYWEFEMEDSVWSWTALRLSKQNNTVRMHQTRHIPVYIATKSWRATLIGLPGTNKTTNSVVNRSRESVYYRFFKTENQSFTVGFSVTKRTGTEKPSPFISVVLFLSCPVRQLPPPSTYLHGSSLCIGSALSRPCS